MSITLPGVRIVDMPDLGVVTDDSSIVGEHAGSGRFTALALRSYVGGAGGTYSIRDFGAKSDGVTDDCNAVTAAIAAILALPHGGKLIVPAGRTVVGCPLRATVPPGVTIAIEGMGTGASELYFSGATDGLDFKLAGNVADVWGSVVLTGLSITRGPTSPVMANIGVNIWVDPAANQMYTGHSVLRDLVITGSTQGGNQWNKSLVVNGVGGTGIDNVVVNGVNATAVDQGDVLVTLTGPNPNQFGVSYAVVNSDFVGGSVGVLVTGYVQGAFISNSTIIGQYDSVRCEGLAAVINHTTTAATATGAVLHFAPGSLTDLVSLGFVSGTNIPVGARTVAVDNAAGTVTINANVTGSGVAAGAVVGFQQYYFSEALSIIGCTLNGGHRGALAIYAGFSAVIGTSILHFPTGTANWAGIELNECNYSTVAANNILGNAVATEVGVLFSSAGYQGTTGNTCVGNNIISCYNSAVYLQGTTNSTTVSANTINGGTAAINQDVLGNAVMGNVWNGNQLPLTINIDHTLGPDIVINGAAGTNRQIAYTTSGGGIRWSLTTEASAEPGGNVGGDFGIFAYNDAGGALLRALHITRATGDVTAFGLLIGNRLAFGTAPINATSDAAAAAAGVPLLGVYKNGNALQVRLV